jgi:hypothetical protein
MYEHVVAETTATDGTLFRVILEPDDSPMNPREDSAPAGMMYVIDQRNYIVPQEGGIPGIDAAIIDHDFRVVARWLRVVHGATVVLPLYSSYGRDFNVSAGDADDTPEAGNYIGVTFDTPDTRQEMGFSGATLELTARALAADTQTYRQWADGDVWGYIVQRGTVTVWDDGDVSDVTWNHAGTIDDSCWGFIGQQWAEEAATEALDDLVAGYNDDADEAAQDAAQDEEEIASMRLAELGIAAV